VRKNILNYAALLLIAGGALGATLELGARLYPSPANQGVAARRSVEGATDAPAGPVAATQVGGVGWVFLENLRHPIGVLLLQIIVVLLAARIVGLFFRKLRQPTVIGEMIAGILLGPSLLGMISPGAMSFLFPPQSMNSLKLLSQVGIIIFMFVVGTEINIRHMRRYAHAAVLVSHASIVIPFFLGTAFCLIIYPAYAPASIPFHAFALFMGVAMSITAFPVLARIIEERGLSKSFIGSVAIACAAVDDVTAWCLLAAVIAVVNAGGFAGATMAIALTVFFIGFMLFLFKPLTERILSREIERGNANGGLAAFILAFVFASALFTEAIGIHALFGAFLAGVVMPSHPRLRPLITEKFESMTVTFLLPLYFAFTGLRVQIGLLNDWESWAVCAGIILIAITGKLCGGALAARLAGMNWRDSLKLGVLMNTRGLIELIVLNVGFDLGILSPRAYSMMVLMALVTTFMTGPLLSLLEPAEKRSAVLVSSADATA
jgi:Kef-type K+ transport system membrane component KefB